MSNIKIFSAIFLFIVTGLMVTNHWRNDALAPATQALKLTDDHLAPRKPQIKQQTSVPITTTKDKALQRRLDIALATNKSLQEVNHVLTEKLDDDIPTNTTIEATEDMGETEKDTVSNVTELAKTTEQLEDRFNQEDQDPEWAETVEQAITNQYFDSQVYGSELIDARCRSTLCRVEMSHFDHEAEALFWINALVVKGLSADQLNIQHIKNQDDGLKTIIFVSRQGHKIYPEEY